MTKIKFLKIVLCTVLWIAVFDIGMKYGMHHYLSRCRIQGDYKKIDYMFKHVNAQILMLGASTCMNSINPETIEKELSKSVFNGGINDQRLEFYDVMTDAIFRYSSPELLILVLRQDDLTIHGDGRLSMMNIYYHCGNAKLDGYLDDGSFRKQILLNSALYRLNTFWWRILLYHFKSFDELAHGGFVGKPVPGILPNCTDAIAGKGPVSVNERKIQCLNHIVATCRKKGTRLWILITPEYYHFTDETRSGELRLIQDFCAKNDIPFIDDTRHPDFINHPEYFYDNNHLNVNGAELYTRHVLDLLKKEGL